VKENDERGERDYRISYEDMTEKRRERIQKRKEEAKKKKRKTKKKEEEAKEKEKKFIASLGGISKTVLYISRGLAGIGMLIIIVYFALEVDFNWIVIVVCVTAIVPFLIINGILIRRYRNQEQITLAKQKIPTKLQPYYSPPLTSTSENEKVVKKQVDAQALSSIP